MYGGNNTKYNKLQNILFIVLCCLCWWCAGGSFRCHAKWVVVYSHFFMLVKVWHPGKDPKSKHLKMLIYFNI